MYKHIQIIILVMLPIMDIWSIDSGNDDDSMLKNLPQREKHAATGSKFLDGTKSASFTQRQDMAVTEILSGNVPEAFRRLVLIDFVNESGDTLQLRVTRDYLAIGSENDFVRMPLSFPSARTVAQELAMFLPTSRIVDAIYEQADLRLEPEPMYPGPEMRSNRYYERHNRYVELQRNGQAADGLIAGHKKDLVITTRMLDQPGRVAIYGWHRGVGDPIQPVSLVHEGDYEDYSHGLRLVDPVALLNGTKVSLGELFEDPGWARLLSEEEGLDPETLSWAAEPGRTLYESER